MFNMRDFVMDTILGMVGKEPEYKVRQYALAWMEKDVLTEDDLAALETHLTEIAARTVGTEED
ncbi:MAG: hypothetical protein IKC04_00440 [Oscillospiraceae bacterium]|nr:hypothetical protein [Oscillospiraceae bacterium]MBR2978294.1 hypothetical protein [Oscillospiraceae bacterium]